MGSFSITHWLILLVVVVVVFGTAKLKNAGKDLGGAVKGFKEAVKDEEPENARKNHVLSHENSTPAARNDLNTRVGNQADDMEISPISTDDQPKVWSAPLINSGTIFSNALYPVSNLVICSFRLI